MRKQNKQSFHYREFLFDEKFIEWRLFRTDEFNTYWSDFISDNPNSKDAIATAIEKFKALRLNDMELSDQQKEDLLNRIIQTSLFQKQKRNRIKHYWYAAACLIVVILSVSSLLFFFNKSDGGVGKLPDVIIGETLPSKDIQLVSGSKVVAIAQNSNIQMHVDGTMSVVAQGESKVSELNLDEEQTNRLIVPYGKRSTLVLSDGTKVCLNAGTKLDFPSSFKGDSRNITVEGEIYIRVSPNKEKPFYVHTSQFSVRVYGTTFNVSSYADNAEKSVVLVEGKVEVTTPTKTQAINPGEIFAIESGKIKYAKVDVDEYTSWIDGIFHFNKAPISDILKKVGRYYNVDFTNSQSPLLQRTCSGQLYLSDDIDKVMSILSALSNTSYKKSGSKIYISPNDK